MPKTGNKNKSSNSVPTLNEYISTQIANKRAASLTKSRNRTSPTLPIIGGMPNKNSCIYTATDNYGKQYRVPGNWTFYENPGKYGFKPIPLEDATPSDIVQVFDKGTPYHAMTLNGYDDNGKPLYNYSRGVSGDNSDIVKNTFNFPNTRKAAYTFVGTPADSTQWTNEYKQLYSNQMKCGGRRKAQLGLSVTDGGTLTPIAKNIFLAQGRTHAQGGIGLTFGKRYNPAGDLEIEKNEIVEIVGGNNVKFNGNKKFKGGGQEASLRVFSSVPLLRGVSPAQLVMAGYDTDAVFKAQEEYKDRNRINDDGTRYEVGGEKIYTPSKSIQHQIQETGRITIGGAPTIGGLRTRGYISGLSAIRRFAKKGTNVFTKGINNLDKKLQSLVSENKISDKTAQFANNMYKQFIGKYGENIPKTVSLAQDDNIKKTGGIYIKPSKRGTFTTAAKKRGMGVQEFASKVLANKEDYSTAMVKKANFARNASRWKKEYGGSMIYTINGNVKNGLMNARPKANLGKYRQIDKNTRVGEDGLIYKRKYDDWYTDGTVHPAYKPAAPSTFLKKDNIKEIGNVKLKSTPIERTYYDEYIEDEEKITTTRDGDRPKDFGMTRTGVNHSTGKYKYNPMTGEKLDETGITETTEPSVKGKTKVSTSSTPRKGGTQATPTATSRGTAKVESPKPATPTNPMEARYASRVQKGIAQEAPKKDTTPYNEAADKNPDKYRYTRSTSFGNPGDVPAKPGNTATGDKDDKNKTPWIGQYKPVRTEDWIGLGSNVVGSIASYLLTKRGLDKMPNPVKPIIAQAAKLKTRHDINAPLSEISQGTQLLRALIRRNTQSSNTSLVREQRAINQAQEARNQLYGQKENIETQSINQDRLNRQSVAMQNVKSYNDYLNRLYAGRVSQNEARISNINNLIGGLTGSVNSMLNTLETRRTTNNTLRAIAAANPNVDARLIGGFDYYEGIGPDGKRKALYDKNQRFVHYI